jgi:hypothetical protein
VDCNANPVLTETIVLPDGGTGVIVTGRDRVWSEPFPPAAGSPAWQVKIAPMPFATITALAALRPTVGSPGWADAYAIANDQVFHLRAETANRWTSTVLPSAAGAPIQVWADPELGRVTYRDGITYTLPLVSPISGPLPEANPAAGAVEELCGAGYAVGQTGLFRLEGDGQWAHLSGAAPAVDGARMIKLGGSLYAFDAQGRTYVITDSACARP